MAKDHVSKENSISISVIRRMPRYYRFLGSWKSLDAPGYLPVNCQKNGTYCFSDPPRFKLFRRIRATGIRI